MPAKALKRKQIFSHAGLPIWLIDGAEDAGGLATPLYLPNILESQHKFLYYRVFFLFLVFHIVLIYCCMLHISLD